MNGRVLRAPYEVEASQRAFLARVYQWMTVGLALTGVVAYLLSQSAPAMRVLFGTPYLLVGLFLVELGLVAVISARAATMAPGTTTALFLVYAALNGVTLSGIFLAYTGASLASTFVITAGTFGATSLYGQATKRDLSGLGGFLFMGLVGLIIASVVNAFLRSETVYWVTTYVGVLVFVGLTAYDTQKLKEIGAGVDAEGGRAGSLAVAGALALYLDFINLFLYLLRFVGRSRD
jgi:FtsH-binding integral membrane protein